MSRKIAKLVKLDFSGRKLSSMTGLKSLDDATYPLKIILSSNFFDTVPVTELSGLDLRVLNLAKNNIHLLPDSLTELHKLEILNLSGNKLIEIRDELLGLTNLRSLDLSGNQLAVVPPVLITMTTLESINLSKNCIHILPTTMIQLTKLQDLQVHGNPLVFPSQDIVHKGFPAIMAHLQMSSTTIGAAVTKFADLKRPPYIDEWTKPVPDCPTITRSHPKTLFPVRSITMLLLTVTTFAVY